MRNLLNVVKSIISNHGAGAPAFTVETAAETDLHVIPSALVGDVPTLERAPIGAMIPLATQTNVDRKVAGILVKTEIAAGAAGGVTGAWEFRYQITERNGDYKSGRTLMTSARAASFAAVKALR